MNAFRSNRSLLGWICSSCEKRTFAWSRTRRFKSTITRKARLPDSPARTRFAPSPTGNLHLGSIRTALFNYLLARRTGGQFLLRVEDTDQKRTVPGAEDRLFQDLRWAGVQWDEGPQVGGPYGPYRQSERIQIYQDNIKPLLSSGKAYRCFCSAERLKHFHESRHERGLPLGYHRKCAAISTAEAEDRAQQGESHVVRFKVPKEYPSYNDLIYGKSGHGSEKLKRLLLDEPVYDDPILLKSDGFPTYHFANVVDDHLMRISHVIRGSEWMSSTPLHIALFEAFNWPPPVYAHVPLLVDSNGQKLSKRNLDTDIASFRTKGIFPDALTNFTALLGWSHQLKTDVMDLSELQSNFDLKITKGNTIVAFEKLTFLQQRHAQRRIETGGVKVEQMVRDVAQALLSRYGACKVMTLIGKRKLGDVVLSILKGTSQHYVNADEFAEIAHIYFDDLPNFEPKEDMPASPIIHVAASTLLLAPEQHWTAGVHRANLSRIDLSPIVDSGLPNNPNTDKRMKGQLYHWLRWALLGGADGPGIPETMEILGRDLCVKRIQMANRRGRDIFTGSSKADIIVEKLSSIV